MLEGAAATVGAQSFALGQSRALAASLGRLAAGSFVERRRRAGDLLEVGATSCRSFGCVGSARRQRRISYRGHRSGRGFCNFVVSARAIAQATASTISSRACLAL